jgi:hypothetical protein
MKCFLLALSLASLFAAAPKAVRNAGVSLLRVPNGGIQPQVAVDAAGALHLLYYSGEAMHGNLFYVKSSDTGATWSPPIRVNSEPESAIATGTIRGGQIAIGANGRVYVAWNGSARTESQGPLNPESGRRGAPMLFSRMNAARTSFEPQRNLMTRTFGLDGGGTVAADPSGNVYVAWHGKAPGAAAGEAGRQVWIAESHDGGDRFAVEHPAWHQPAGACGCCGMALLADPSGTIRALFRSATGGVHRDIYLLTSRDGGGAFEGRMLQPWELNACPMSSMFLAEGAGKVEASWETAGQVWFEDIASSSAQPVAAPGEGKGRKHPRLAIARDGSTLLLWSEGAAWGKGGSLAWRIFDAAGSPVGEKGAQDSVPAWSFGAVAATRAGFVVID